MNLRIPRTAQPSKTPLYFHTYTNAFFAITFISIAYKLPGVYAVFRLWLPKNGCGLYLEPANKMATNRLG